MQIRAELGAVIHDSYVDSAWFLAWKPRSNSEIEYGR
jgi:hypothetical protein